MKIDAREVLQAVMGGSSSVLQSATDAQALLELILQPDLGDETQERNMVQFCLALMTVTQQVRGMDGGRTKQILFVKDAANAVMASASTLDEDGQKPIISLQSEIYRYFAVDTANLRRFLTHLRRRLEEKTRLDSVLDIRYHLDADLSHHSGSASASASDDEGDDPVSFPTFFLVVLTTLREFRSYNKRGACELTVKMIVRAMRESTYPFDSYVKDLCGTQENVEAFVLAIEERLEQFSDV